MTLLSGPIVPPSSQGLLATCDLLLRMHEQRTQLENMPCSLPLLTSAWLRQALPNGHPEEQSQLLQEVEMERRRAAALVTALNSAKQERDEAQRLLQELRAGMAARSQPSPTPPGLPKGVLPDPAIPNGKIAWK